MQLVGVDLAASSAIEALDLEMPPARLALLHGVTPVREALRGTGLPDNVAIDCAWAAEPRIPAGARSRHQSGSMPFDRSVAFEDSEARKRRNSSVAARCPLPIGMATVKTM